MMIKLISYYLLHWIPDFAGQNMTIRSCVQKIAGFIPASHNLKCREDSFGFMRSRHKAGNVRAQKYLVWLLASGRNLTTSLCVQKIAGCIPASHNLSFEDYSFVLMRSRHKAGYWGEEKQLEQELKNCQNQ